MRCPRYGKVVPPPVDGAPVQRLGGAGARPSRRWTPRSGPDPPDARLGSPRTGNAQEGDSELAGGDAPSGSPRPGRQPHAQPDQHGPARPSRAPPAPAPDARPPAPPHPPPPLPPGP